jgi:ATP-binding cassette subfamily B protein
VRLFDPDSGSINLDGEDLRALRLADLRRHVRVVEQEPTLFHASIDENVRFDWREAGVGEVADAIEAAGLASFVAALPEGRRTMVGDRGLALAAGERQRIALARALLANPSVLVLDEPSAALDPAAERRVLEGYRRVMRGRTVIVISHRIELVRAADEAVVIDGARIVQQGRPADLEAGGAFAALFATSRPAAAT